MSKESHIADADLILAADGEMSMLRKTQVQSHLVHCWTCRARMKELEDTIADFARAYQHGPDTRMDSASASRALLKARLSELAAEQPMTIWQRLSGPSV